MDFASIIFGVLFWKQSWGN